MELVNLNKLEAVADFLSDDEVFGIAPCSHFNNSLKRDRVDVSCDKDGYIKALEEYCDNLGDALADAEYAFEEAECENRELTEKLEKVRGVLDGKY